MLGLHFRNWALFILPKRFLLRRLFSFAVLIFFYLLEPLFLDDVLRKYKLQLKTTSGKQPVNFNRFQMSALRQLMRLMKDPTLDMRKEPDVMFEGELGADLGGPKKKFFSRALQSLVEVDQVYKIQLFGGLEDHRVPLYNVDAIYYYYDHILVGLAPAVVEYLSTGSVSKAASKVTIDDVCDLELKEIIEKV